MNKKQSGDITEREFKSDFRRGSRFGFKSGSRQGSKQGFKRGAASFYIVAFSTLILVVIATSFAMVIISEISRTENDDLSQSAYDSALAGVEDAKVAYSNYRRCLDIAATNPSVRAQQPTSNGTVTCNDILYWVENPDCYMVGHILGKINKMDEEEVAVGGTVVASGSTETTTNQAYTCDIINTDLSDYRATLSANNMVQTIRASVGSGPTNNVDKIRISWYSVRSDITLKFANFLPYRGVIFPALTNSTIATPPTLELQIAQTGTSFTMAQFDEYTTTSTNRATLYLVPTSTGSTNSGANYIAAYNGSKNFINAAQVARTNSRTVSNKPFAVYCNTNTSEEFYCSAEIELPDVIGGNGKVRSNETFMLSVAMPYKQPDTDFSIELICSGGRDCGVVSGEAALGSGDKVAKITNTQVSIDSTGRANDLYRRVETRLETSDTTFGFGSPYYALQILGSGTTEKNLKVTSEYNFYF